MSSFNFFRPKTWFGGWGGTFPLTIHSSKTTSPFSFADMPDEDFSARREQSRKIYSESLIAKNIIQRLTDFVINIGLTWESSPLWDILKDSPGSEKEKKTFIRRLENLWKLFTETKEADYRGQFTFNQLQRKLFKLAQKEGEFFVVLKYLSDPTRLSPVTLQILNNDQIIQPLDSELISAAENRGNVIIEGIEFDNTGKEIAIYIIEELGGDPVRIPFFSKTGKRRFVIHYTNHHIRGKSRLASMAYELDRLAKYDEAELEAVVNTAKFIGAIELDKNAARPSGGVRLGGSATAAGKNEKTKSGIKNEELDGHAIIINNLPPGASFKGFQPNRPNQNYELFTDAFITRLAGLWGMPLSFFKILFSSSYSAGRAESLLAWNAIQVFRSNFADGFLNLFKEAVISEWERNATLSMPGFSVSLCRAAWLYGMWNGIGRPVVDPVKEINAIKLRTELGHTTGEREAKAYNGSDFSENIERLKIENPALASANATITTHGYIPMEEEKRDKK